MKNQLTDNKEIFGETATIAVNGMLVGGHGVTGRARERGNVVCVVERDAFNHRRRPSVSFVGDLSKLHQRPMTLPLTSPWAELSPRTTVTANNNNE